MPQESLNPFEQFVHTALQHPNDPAVAKAAATEFLNKVSPEEYARFLLQFLFDTNLSKKGVTALLCVPFVRGDDGHDYPGEHFLLGDPGPLDAADHIQIAISAIQAKLRSQHPPL